MENSKRIAPIPVYPLIVAFLNLTGLGLGYLYLKRSKFWVVSFLGTLALITFAIIGNASRAPLEWIIIFGLWLVWMVADGARQAVQVGAAPETPEGNLYIPVLLAALVILGELGAFLGFAAWGDQVYSMGNAAFRAGDCSAALNSFNLVTSVFELTFSPNIAPADEKIFECDEVVAVEKIWSRRQFDDAILQYKKFIVSHPKSPLVPHVRTAIAKVYYDWGNKLRIVDEPGAAILKYSVVLGDYSDTGVSGEAKTAIAESHSEWATLYRKRSKFEDALSKYKVIVSNYPATPTGRWIANAIAETYNDWAAYLRKQANYSEAVQKYRTILKEYRETTTAPQISVLLADTYAEWATQLRKKEKFDEAVDIYRTLLREFSETPTGQQTRQWLIDAYGDWAVQLRNTSRYEEAIAKYEYIVSNYPEAKESASAKITTGQVYIDWAKDLRSKGKFILALDKLNQAKQMTLSKEVVDTAAKAYDETLISLSQDTGTDGRKVMDDTLTAVLNGKPAVSPAVGTAKGEPGKALVQGGYVTLPDDLSAVKPSHFIYAISVDSNLRQAGTCGPYIAERSGVRSTMITQQSYWRVQVRDTRTASVLSERTFDGSTPGCPSQFVGNIYATTHYRSGDPPSSADVINWLRGIVR